MCRKTSYSDERKQEEMSLPLEFCNRQCFRLKNVTLAELQCRSRSKIIGGAHYEFPKVRVFGKGRGDVLKYRLKKMFQLESAPYLTYIKLMFP